MQFKWTQVAKPPAPDEVEITIIGPGFGECILVHVGHGEWLIVDSCRDPQSNEPVALAYLKALGFDPNAAVRWIVATHWHKDHIDGLDEVVSVCRNAEFHCGTALLKREFLQYVAQSQMVSSADNAREFREIISILISHGRQPKWTQGGRVLFVCPPRGTMASCRGEALSPSDKEYSLFLNFIASQLAVVGRPHRAAVARDPNHAAIVLSLSWGDEVVLLGADLLTHSDRQRGWLAAIAQAKILNIGKAGLVKIPHHGSAGAHHPKMWSDLLLQKPLSAITPYSRGRKEGRPPKITDLSRISKLSSETMLTAPTQSGRVRKPGSAIAAGLAQSQIKVRTLRAGIGIGRYRRSRSSVWELEMFGRAKKI